MRGITSEDIGNMVPPCLIILLLTSLLKTESLSVSPDVGEIPGNIMAHMNASEILHLQSCRECAGFTIIHMFVDMDRGRDKRIDKEEICSCKERKAFCRNTGVGIGGECDFYLIISQDKAISLCWRMVYRNQRQCESEKIDGAEWFNGSSGESEEPEDSSAVLKDPGGRIDLRHCLDTVEFAKSHEMVIMAMGPYHRIDMRGSVGKQLLPEIGGRVNQDCFILMINQKRGP